VLDASALLALLFGEQGGDRVSGRLAGAAISTVNWAEVAQRILEEARTTPVVEPASTATGEDPPPPRDHEPWERWAASVEGARFRLEAVGLTIHPYLREDAHEAALIRLWTKDLGLSLGDRSCLALGRRLDVPALTADRAWAALPAELSLDVEQIR
jgi:PIN domain nuclease of toxin-antitoxin system